MYPKFQNAVGTLYNMYHDVCATIRYVSQYFKSKSFNLQSLNIAFVLLIVKWCFVYQYLKKLIYKLQC